MSVHAEILACVDDDQCSAEFEGRELPRGSARIARIRFKTPLDLVRLILLAVRHRPTVVHFQEAAGPRRGFFSACLLELAKPFARTVLTVHDPVPHVGRDAGAARRTAWIRDYVRRRVDTVVVHGQYCADSYRQVKRSPKQQVVVSTHGLILDPPHIERLAGGKLRLFFFGRMEAYKGVGVLLLMAEILHERGFDYELLVAGRGPELDRLQARFERLPNIRVFNGFVRPTEVMRSIQQAECVILPYLSATQSGVLAAAYAGMRYVIASDTGGLRDVVTHRVNGILVPPDDAPALAEAVMTLAVDQSLRQTLLAGARVTAGGTLDWGCITRDLQRDLHLLP